jgi:hypothetical protein
MFWHRSGGGGPFRPGSSNFTSYPGARTLIPGIGFASRLPPSEMENLHSVSKYDIPKSISEEPNLSAISRDQESITVSNKPEPTLQLGFGLIPETDFQQVEENEIDNEVQKNEPKESLKIDSKVLNAFEHPVFPVKKEMFISGQGKKKTLSEGVKGKNGKQHFLKIVKKKN